MKPPYDAAQARRALMRRDPVLGGMICRIGPCTLSLRRPAAPFPALLRAIVYQQLSGKAANTIHGRVLELFPGRAHPAPEQFLAIPEEQLRGAGLSRNKMLAVRDLAAKVLDGTVPDLRRLRAMSDADIIEHLVQVRGIGRWTVEMLLIFNLGRPDVLPLDDLGVRKGFARAFDADPANRDALAERGERWGPWRSVAAWYLWRVADTEML